MQIKRDIPLSTYTTLQVGGQASYLVEVNTVDELEQARLFALQENLPVLVLGGGSNVLVSDAGYAGLVIINLLQGVAYKPLADSEVLVQVGAGVVFDTLVADTVDQGLWGLENLSHIPGTVGAAPIQNVGAYGTEVSSLITQVQALSLQTGELKIFSNDECQFAYRDSYFKTDAGRAWVITQVTFKLTTKRTPNLTYGDLQSLDAQSCSLSDVRAKVIAIRAGKFPDWHQIGTAGSFFKNPIIPADHRDRLVAQYPELPTYVMPDGQYKVSLGWILDKVCGLRGHQVDAVGLYKDQALVLINTGQSATAISEFAASVQAIVADKTEITIEPEVRYV